MESSRFYQQLRAAIPLLGLLLVLSVQPAARAATQAEIDQAIEDGLAWLATQQGYNGAFGYHYYLANTATAVLAFENEGHFPGGGTAYSSNVEAGLDWIFNYCRVQPIYLQSYGGRNDDPDTNGNGLGAYFNYNSSMYETGLVMQAIVATNTPNRVVTTGSDSHCKGLTYHEVMTDLVDYLAWAQVDGGSGRGGWYYYPYNNRAANSDNSVAQWPVLGLVAAEQWGIFAPLFVKDELEYWVTYIQHADGGSGYHHPNSYRNVSKTGGLLVEQFYLGDDHDSARALRAQSFIDSRWNTSRSGWYGNKGHPYAMFSVFKGLELMDIATIPNAPANSETSAGDWWGDYAEYLVNLQRSNGSWPGYYYWNDYLATPWYIIILQASVFPVSVDIEVPDTACDDTGYEVEVHYAVERFEADGTLSIYRDGDLFDTIALNDFMGSDTVSFTVAPETVGIHTWRAVLEVTGGGITTSAEDLDGGEVMDAPEVGDIPDQMMPFEPFDLDDFVTCLCDDVDWSVSGVPADWTVTIDADNVVTVTPSAGAVDPVELTFDAVIHYPGIDCFGSDTATFTPNRAPVAHPGKIYPEQKYLVIEGSSVPLDGTQSYDPDGDDIAFAWDLDGDTVFETPGATPDFSAAGLDNPPTDEVYIYLEVCDIHDACDIALAEVEILDAAPTAAFLWAPRPQAEGSLVGFTDQSTSPVDTLVGWQWDFAALGTSSLQNPSFGFLDNGTYGVCLAVTDDDGSTADVCNPVDVVNLAPNLGALTGPTEPALIFAPITVGGSFTDPGIVDTHSALCDWGDSTSSAATVAQGAGSGSISAEHAYEQAGAYTIECTVTDDDGGADTSVYDVVILDRVISSKEKVKVHFHDHDFDGDSDSDSDGDSDSEGAHCFTKLDLDGQLTLRNPASLPIDVREGLDAVEALLVVSLAGFEIAEQTVVLEVKDADKEKWEFKRPSGEPKVGLKKVKLDWKDQAEYDSHLGSGLGADVPQVESRFIGFDETDIKMHFKSVLRPFTVQFVDGGRIVTVTVWDDTGDASVEPVDPLGGYDLKAKKDSLEMVLPFRLTPETAISYATGGEPFEPIPVDPEVNYSISSAKYMVDMDETAISDALCGPDPLLVPTLNSLSNPTLDIEIRLGLGLSQVVGFVEVDPPDWDKLSGKHWEVKR